VDDVKIHTGTRVKLKRVDESAFPVDFLAKLREFAHQADRIEVIFLFVLQPDDQPEQLSLAIGVKSSLLSKDDEVFINLVDEIQLLLPEDVSVNLYRFGASSFLAKYCVENLEPLYLRNAAWLARQRKKFAKA